MLRAINVRAKGMWSGKPADRVTLDFEARHRRRMVMHGDEGLAFLLDLSQTTRLRHGDALVLEDGRLVEVFAAAESLCELTMPNAHALPRLAWHLGNRHLPVEIAAANLRMRHDPIIEAMARGLGARAVRLEAAFEPEAGIAGAPAHRHAHE